VPPNGLPSGLMKLVSIPANPAPNDVVTGAIATPDGVNLRFARWAPPPGRKGTVLVLQGRAEFIEKYFETVRDLRARGFAVATFDWRGQGLSDRALSDRHKGHVRNFANYITDLEAVMEQVILPDCPPPYFVLAHSMGAAVALRACHDGNRWFERMVFSAPMIALPPGRLTRVAGPLARLMRMIGRGRAYVPTSDSAVMGAESFIGNVLTSDPVRYARNAAVLEQEPALGLGAPTVAWADAALRQIKAELMAPADGLDTLPGVHGLEVRDSQIRLDVDSDQIDLVVRRLAELGVTSLESHPPTLEELFLVHYGDELAREPARDSGGPPAISR